MSAQSIGGLAEPAPSTSMKSADPSSDVNAVSNAVEAAEYLEAVTREIIEAANNGTWREVASQYYVSLLANEAIKSRWP